MNAPRTSLAAGTLAGLWLALGASAPAVPSQEGPPARPVPRIEEGKAVLSRAIEALELEAHVGFLAEHCEGRGTGTAGERRAAEYLAARLFEAGLLPAGDLGPDGVPTYFQDLGLVRRSVVGTPRLLLHGADGSALELNHGEDFRVEGPHAVAGSFPLVVARALSEVLEPGKAELVCTAESHGRARDWLRTRVGEPLPRVLIAAGGARIAGRNVGLESSAGLAPTLVLSMRRELLSRLLAGEFVRAELAVEALWEPVPSANVLARLPATVSAPAAVGEGRDGAADGGHRVEGDGPEAIVLSAHYDHMGVRAARPNDGPDADLVFDGADDDASGVAAALEIAEALAFEQHRARDLVVLFATGEEIGLIGTRHYLNHPVVPLSRTVANVNLEMVGRPDPLIGRGRLWLTGFERTNLGSTMVDRGLDVSPDLRPEQNFFRRSDNYAFAELGIVAQTLSSFGMHEDYHRESDAWWTLDYEHMEAALAPALEVCRLLVAGEFAPMWLPGGRP